MSGWHRIFEDSFKRFFFDTQFSLIKSLDTCYQSEINAKINSCGSEEISKVPDFRKFLSSALTERVVAKHDKEEQSIKKRIEEFKIEEKRSNRGYCMEKLGDGLNLGS